MGRRTRPKMSITAQDSSWNAPRVRSALFNYKSKRNENNLCARENKHVGNWEQQDESVRSRGCLEFTLTVGPLICVFSWWWQARSFCWCVSATAQLNQMWWSDRADTASCIFTAFDCLISSPSLRQKNKLDTHNGKILTVERALLLLMILFRRSRVPNQSCCLLI